MENVKDDDIWQAINYAVESGEETLKIDLKSKFPCFDKEEDKAEFVKDISAIANVSGKIGYIVIGVLDKKQRTTNNPNDYVIGFDPQYLETLKQQMVQLVQDYITPPIIIDYRSLTHPQTGRKIGVMIIPSEYDRPYVISKNIGKLNKVSIFTRSVTHTIQASHSEIVRMTIEDEEVRHKEELERAEGANKDARLRLEEENDTLRHENNLLKDAKRREIEDKDTWISAAAWLCKKLYDELPTHETKEQIRRLLERFGKEDYCNAFFKE